MKKPNTHFAEYLEEQKREYGSVMVPIPAGILERLVVRRVHMKKLHPNPDDEFCNPSVGPSFQIISKYVGKYQQYNSMVAPGELAEETLLIQKVHPDGYMLLNGHHRWAAYWMLGVNWLPVSIVNLTQETDIERMVRDSRHDKRVTLDLDEVVFCHDSDDPAEKPLPFPANRIYKEKIRRGIPALLHGLSVQGYDIWVYTAKYYSMDYIKEYFKRYSVKVDGIITGSGRKQKNAGEVRERTRKLINTHYAETLHIDRNIVLRTFSASNEFEEYEIKDSGPAWSQEVLSIIKGMKKNDDENRENARLF